MPELSANARWLMDNLIDNDRQALADITRRGEQYVAAGMPQDNRLGQVARMVVDDAIRRHNQAWPDAAIGFPAPDLAQAADEIAQRIRTQAARSWRRRRNGRPHRPTHRRQRRGGGNRRPPTGTTPRAPRYR